MATLTGYNTLRTFIGDYDSLRASNVSCFRGWEGDIYFFEKRSFYEGRTFTASCMEVEGTDLIVYLIRRVCPSTSSFWTLGASPKRRRLRTLRLARKTLKDPWKRVALAMLP